MPEDRTPIDHGLAHPQPERGRIPQPKPEVDEDRAELVNNQRTVTRENEKRVSGDTGEAPAGQKQD